MKKTLFTLLTLLVFACYASSQVVITEIMYNDPTSGQDPYEYIELYNNGSAPVNLEGWQFTRGVTFTFPSHTLNAGEFVIVSVNSTQFETQFGVPAFQWDMNQALNNGGATIELKNAGGVFVDSVRYSSMAPWPNQAAGNGASLVLCDVDSDNADPANWGAATTATGFMIAGKDVFANPGEISTCNAGISFQLPGFSLMETDGTVEVAVRPSGGDFQITRI